MSLPRTWFSVWRSSASATARRAWSFAERAAGTRRRGRRGRAQHQVRDLGELVGLGVVDLAVLRELAELLLGDRARRVDELELTALQTVQPLLLIGNRLERDRVEVGELVAVLVLRPVVRVLVDGHVVVDDPLTQLERTGADEVLGAVRAVELSLGHDPEPAARPQVRGEGRPWLGDGHRHGAAGRRRRRT